ncbi:MAG TPA: enoyl-CoA hydratase/isomerase family protein [Ilumatobacter sp.]|nr:enoyl-CoA hydratase/isomerase family protein [Ilumatobacter sp.]
MTESSTLLVERIDLEVGAASMITLNRPEHKNPIDKVTLNALRAELERADAESDIRTVIITGAGDAFSAGGDLRGYVELYQDPRAFRAFLEDFSEVCALLESGAFASIAMVNGACVAGGIEVALACDFIIVAEHAKIGDGHLNFGQLPGAGGSQRLCRAVGLQHAKDLLLTGRLLTGVEAVAIGLATEAVPADGLLARVIEIAASTSRHSPLAIRRMKELILVSQDVTRADALARELDIVATYATTSHDAVEGLHAFGDRRTPNWTGR